MKKITAALLTVFMFGPFAFSEQTTSIKMSESDIGIQEIRDLLNMTDNNVAYMDRDIKVLSDNENSVKLVGDECVVTIDSTKQIRERAAKQWAVMYLDVRIESSKGKWLAFLSMPFPDKVKIASKKKSVKISQSRYPEGATALHDRGYLSDEQLRRKKRYAGSPEGRMAMAIATEGLHAMSGGIFRSYVDQTVAFETSTDGSLKSVSVTVEGRKLTCRDIQ